MDWPGTKSVHLLSQGGKVWLVYENPVDMFAQFNVPKDAKVVMQLTKVLGALTGKAVAK